MKDTTPQAVQAAHELLLWLIPQIDKFPRVRRFTLGERLESAMLEVLELSVQAAYTHNKRAALQRANLPREVAPGEIHRGAHPPVPHLRTQTPRNRRRAVPRPGSASCTLEHHRTAHRPPLHSRFLRLSGRQGHPRGRVALSRLGKTPCL